KQLTELDQNQGYYNEYYQDIDKLTLSKLTLSNDFEKGSSSSFIIIPEIIECLEARVQYLEETNKQLNSFFKKQILYHQQQAEYYLQLCSSY
ncbi:19843_t:CDS:2, partial [Gigaspora margarita]